MDEEYDAPPALGTVVEVERGSLPFALLHGEALVACASWALGDSGVTPVDIGTEWAGIVAGEEPFVLHDSLCPMTPGSFIAECVAHCLETDTVTVGVRPVTDTVKRIDGDLVGTTLDRDDLMAIASPIVLPASVVAALESLPAWDFVELVTALSNRFPVAYREAPPQARRIADAADIAVLEALTAQAQPLGR